MALNENWEDQPRDWQGRWVAEPPKPGGVSELLPPRTLRRRKPSFEEKSSFDRQIKNLLKPPTRIGSTTRERETERAFPDILAGSHEPAARYKYNKDSINRKLRGGDTQFALTDFEQETVAGLDKLLDDPRNRTSEEVVVHRGVANMKDVFGSEWCSSCSMSTYEGLSWVERGFANASADDDIAENQVRSTDSAVLNIVVPKGTSALALTDYVGGRKAVQDLIFPRGTRFRIISARRDDENRLQLNVEIDAADQVTAAALAERDVNAPGPGHDLREYWVRGPGAAKIGWGTDGSFARCVVQLGKYVKNPQGLCAEYHKAATGEWPAEKGVESDADVEAFHAGEKHGSEDCPPGHHRMPDGECMADEDMKSYTAAANKTPYGDVKYADPGYQGDGVKRYPIDTEEHVRAAWSYINQVENAAKYSAADLRKVRARIKAAARRFGVAISEDSDDASVTSATESRYAAAERSGGFEMSWRIEKRNGEFAIVADANDEVVGAFADRSRAVSLLRRLHATKAGLSDALISAAEASTLGAAESERVVEAGRTAPWVGVLTVEGVESGDGRMFGAQGLSWDEPPLPLMWQKETSHGGNTDRSVRVGSILKIYREPDASGRSDVFLIRGEGTLDLDNEDGAEVFRRMKNGDMRGNSVDVDSIKGADVELVYPEVGEGAGTESLLTQAFAQPELTIYRKGRIRATTMVEIPAFTEARLELVRDDVVTASDDCRECQKIVVEDADGQRLAALTAATATIEVPDLPPRGWFEEPTDVAMDGALTVTAEGRIYGMVAPAGVRHRSFTQREQYVPLGRVDYDRYHGGQTLVADGGRVSTGNVTMDCGHATTAVRLTPERATEHYDNTCSIVATACVGENERGVWIAGALLPDVDAATVRRVMACRLSGDWRTHLDRQGWREFVAALLVPVPGFPMERSPVPTVEISEGELVASSVPVRLVIGDQPVTARSLRRDQVAAIAQRVGRDPAGRRAVAVARVRSHRVAAMAGRVEAFRRVSVQNTDLTSPTANTKPTPALAWPAVPVADGDWARLPALTRRSPDGTVLARANSGGVAFRLIKRSSQTDPGIAWVDVEAQPTGETDWEVRDRRIGVSRIRELGLSWMRDIEWTWS